MDLQRQGQTGGAPRRQTRAALAEIPARIAQLRVALQTVTPNANRTNATLLLEATPAGLPAGYMSPAASPDELVIQQRGRRRAPVTWSPDNDTRLRSPFQSFIRTPPKNGPASPNKAGLRSTPRKRLLLTDTEKLPFTPEKIDFSDVKTPQKLKVLSPTKTSLSVKRLRVDKLERVASEGPIAVSLQALSNKQLIDLISTMVQKHPTLESDLKNNMPIPDLKPLEEKLNYLKGNIYRSLPNSRLTSITDSPSHSRARIHVLEFKKCLLDQGKLLANAQQWSSVIDYVSMAWCYVRCTPVWDNMPHNTPRKQCFKALSTFCMMALKKGNFSKSMLIEIQDKLHDMIADSEDIQCCVKWVQSQVMDL